MSKFEIDGSILKQSGKCEKGFSCLEGGDICEVDFLSESSGTLFIECKEDDKCTYKTFMSSTVCSCPARKELYIKYGV